MYLTKIELHNIRCFEDLEVNFKRDNQITLWTTLSGDNAVGKTTLLRCIALGLVAFIKLSMNYLNRRSCKISCKFLLPSKTQWMNTCLFRT